MNTNGGARSPAAAAAAAAMAAVALIGCGSMQKSDGNGSAGATPPPAAKSEAPKDTQQVKGLNGWEGEITGKPASNSKFTKLQIGMGMKQVTDIVGQPTDQGAYVTGKAWIPFYFGSDRHRYELVYKAQGRLIFAGGGMGDLTSGNLIWIIHNAQEGGYR